MRFLREPLLHFAVAGSVLFAGYERLNRDQPDSGTIEPVRIGEGEVKWLRETFTGQWLRPPDPTELRGLVAGLLNEELLAREAEAIGLGENDTIIRRRLAQKLTFLVEDTSRLVDPTDAELREFYKGNADVFLTAPTVSFTHLFFNPQSHLDAAGDATAALAELQDVGLDGRAAANIGDRFLLDTKLTDSDEEKVAAVFGPDFAQTVFALEPGAWGGPIKSGYGLHLVFVAAKTVGAQPPLDQIRDKVVMEWRRQKEEKANQDYLARLREKYGVVLDDSVKALLAPAAAVAVR